MRIIAGSKRGMKLLSPKTQDSRPIIDRVKESLFSVLYKYDLPDDTMVADLFCGVGSLGLEALSRGA
ncbi:MAG: RsmD family RNA methyltransferase, partial [Planctomycetota bacterium]